jgi:hypothetical protein
MVQNEPAKETKTGGAKSALDRLERHASRLSGASSVPPSGEETPAARASGLRRFTSMGIEFLAVVLIFGLIGQWLDHQFHWHGVATVVLICIAVIGDLYLQIKMLLQNGNAEIKRDQIASTNNSPPEARKDTHLDD